MRRSESALAIAADGQTRSAPADISRDWPLDQLHRQEGVRIFGARAGVINIGQRPVIEQPGRPTWRPAASHNIAGDRYDDSADETAQVGRRQNGCLTASGHASTAIGTASDRSSAFKSSTAEKKYSR